MCGFESSPDVDPLNRWCCSPTAAQYLFQAPNHYIFHGAEVYSDSEDETSSSCGSDESDCSGGGEEDDSEEPEEAEALAAEGAARLRDSFLRALADEAPSARTDSTCDQTQSTTPL